MTKSKAPTNKEMTLTISFSSPEKILKTIIFLGVCFLSLTPLIVKKNFFFPYVGPKSLFFMAWVEIIFFFWLILILYSPSYRPKKNIFLVSLLVYFSILILSTIFGVDPARSFWSKFERMTGLLLWFHLLGFFLVLGTTFQKKDWEKIFLINTFIGTIIALIARFSKDPGMQGGGTLGNDSFLGTVLLFYLFIGLYLLLSSSKMIKILVAPNFLTTSIILLLSQARAAKLSFLGGLFLLFLFYLIFASSKKILKILGLALLLLSFLFLLGASLYVAKLPQEKLNAIFIQLAMMGRIKVWSGAWQAFLEKPWLGWGPENFELAFDKYFHPCLFLKECGGEVWFDRAHNLIFDTLVATGLLGFLAYLAFWFILFASLLKAFWQKKIDFTTAFLPISLFLAYLVQNLTVFDMVSSYFLFFLILSFCFSNLISQKPVEQKKQKFNFSPALILIFLIFLFAFQKFIIKPAQADTQMIKTLNSWSPEQKIANFQKTLQLTPLGKYQNRDFFAQNVLQFANKTDLRNFSRESINNLFDYAIQESEKSISESPLDYKMYLNLGKLLYTQIIFNLPDSDSEKLNRAEIVLKKAIELSPNNQQGYWDLAQVKVLQKDFQNAAELARKAISLEPRLEESYFVLMRIAKIAKDRQLLQETAQELLKINPEASSTIQAFFN